MVKVGDIQRVEFGGSEYAIEFNEDELYYVVYLLGSKGGKRADFSMGKEEEQELRRIVGNLPIHEFRILNKYCRIGKLVFKEFNCESAYRKQRRRKHKHQ